MTKVVQASAPAKVILFGEHAVVYGYPAIAVALNLRAKVSASLIEQNTSSNDSYLYLIAKDYNIERKIGVSNQEEFQRLTNTEKKVIEPFLTLIKVFQQKFETLFSVKIEVTSSIPKGAGLGSSAAVSVATSTALSELLGIDLSLAEISALAYEAEKVLHGTPSGIDNTTATYGAGLIYEKGSFTPIELPEIPLIIGNTGVERQTRKLVGYVRYLHDKYPEIVSPILEQMGKITREAISILKNNDNLDLQRLGELMNINHGLLSAVGVSSLELDVLVNEARKHGALGAKLTGAGGGGCMIALIDDNSKETVKRALTEKKAETIATHIATKGALLYDS